MIVDIRGENSWWSPAVRKSLEHIMEVQPKSTPASMNELWKQEFDIEMIMDPTGTGYKSMRFRDENHYLMWLLKWG